MPPRRISYRHRHEILDRIARVLGAASGSGLDDDDDDPDLFGARVARTIETIARELQHVGAGASVTVALRKPYMRAFLPGDRPR